MRTRILLAAVAVSTVWAQEARTFVFERNTGPAPIGGEHILPQSIKGAPYSADAVTETSQVLADGNRIVNRQSGFVARDSQGRTRNDTGIKVLAPSTATDKSWKIVMIHDPVSEVTYTLESATKTARKVSTASEPAIAEAKAKKRAAEKASLEIVTRDRPANLHSKEAANFKTESLGTQMIEGVMAEGTRTVTTIVAGEMGNEKDIQIVNEVWVAQDLKAVVLSKRNDPRSGEVTFKLTNIQRAEPDASLFEVPADYRILDGPSSKERMFFIQRDE